MTRDEFLSRVQDAEPVKDFPTMVRLGSLPAEALHDGWCYIQDPSTLAACELLDPRSGENVLDACAAPGGKTAFIAELMQNKGAILATDANPDRLTRLEQNLKRLGVLNAVTGCRDWIEPDPGVTPGQFDAILVDAPCTNTGVLRRRVDARWRIRPVDFETMPKLQLSILRGVAKVLKPGGRIVYSTCSIEPEENEEVIAAFLNESPKFKQVSLRKSLPNIDGIDGAFAVLLQSD